MATVKYTREHEWLRLEGEFGVVGITDYAQQQLGDVVFVELPQVGARLKRGDEVAVVESVKAASELYSPATGEVVAVNEALAEEPATVNADPSGKGWFFKLKLDDVEELASLMDATAYKKLLASLE